MPLRSAPPGPGCLSTAPHGQDCLRSGSTGPDCLRSGPPCQDCLRSGPPGPACLRSGPPCQDGLRSGPPGPDCLRSCPLGQDFPRSSPHLALSDTSAGLVQFSLSHFSVEWNFFLDEEHHYNQPFPLLCRFSVLSFPLFLPSTLIRPYIHDTCSLVQICWYLTLYFYGYLFRCCNENENSAADQLKEFNYYVYDFTGLLL